MNPLAISVIMKVFKILFKQTQLRSPTHLIIYPIKFYHLDAKWIRNLQYTFKGRK